MKSVSLKWGVFDTKIPYLLPNLKEPLLKVDFLFLEKMQAVPPNLQLQIDFISISGFLLWVLCLCAKSAIKFAIFFLKSPVGINIISGKSYITQSVDDSGFVFKTREKISPSNLFPFTKTLI